MTSFLKFSFNRPRVPSVLGEESEVGEVALFGEFAFVRNDEPVLLKLEAAVDAMDDNDVVIELGRVPPPPDPPPEVSVDPLADCCSTSNGSKFEFSAKLS